MWARYIEVKKGRKAVMHRIVRKKHPLPAGCHNTRITLAERRRNNTREYRFYMGRCMTYPRFGEPAQY